MRCFSERLTYIATDKKQFCEFCDILLILCPPSIILDIFGYVVSFADI